MEAKDKQLMCLGLVLRSQEYSDKDLIFSILTENSGKVSAIAKSAKGGKKFSSGIPEILDLGMVELRRGRGPMYYVQSFKPQQAFKQLRINLYSFICACCWIEALDHLTAEAHSESHELFAVAVSVLEAMNQVEDARQSCRVLCQGFDLALIKSGFGSEHQNLAIGYKKMQAQAARIVEMSGRELKSWSSVVELVSTFDKQ